MDSMNICEPAIQRVLQITKQLPYYAMAATVAALSPAYAGNDAGVGIGAGHGASEVVRKHSYQLPHIEQAAVIDGKIDEAVWQNALPIELKYENKPGEGTRARVATLAYIYEDGENLYVAIKADDPEPAQIRGSLRDRDALWMDDNVGIILDTFNDQRGAYQFYVNPLGVQADMRMSDTDGWDEDDSWDAIWDSAGQITDEGYVVEMSIPFRALRFPDVEGPLTWNIAVWRNYPRDTKVEMANYRSNRDLKCNICQFEQLKGFEQIAASNNFQVTPTLTVSRNDTRETPDGEWQQGEVDNEAGFDLRWGVTQDMVLNATLNPDFSQVEADSGQLDVNNTYSLFFPEKRPFFLDGADYFSSERFDLVHTRNIAEPDYGTKLTGKSGEHSYGLLVANDQQSTFLIPGNQGSDLANVKGKSDITIASYKMDYGDRNNLGVMMTRRSGPAYSNTVASMDGIYWLDEGHKLSYQLLFSESDNPLSLQASKDDDGFELAPQQRDHAYSVAYNYNSRDYNFYANYKDIGEDFRADLGFMTQADIKRAVIGGRRTWYGDEDSRWTRWAIFGDWDKSYDQNGKLLEEEVELHGNLQGPMQFFSNFGLEHRKRFYDDEYFNETQFKTYTEFTPLSGLTFEGFMRLGKQIDFANTRLGDVFLLESTVIWQATRHLEVDVTHEFNTLKVDGGRLFTANLSDVRLSYQFDSRNQLKFVVQYTDIDRELSLYKDPGDREANNRYFSSQLIYSYKINPQTLFFFGYSDSGKQEEEFVDLTRTDRTVFAKFSYAWQA